jgi:hypothetical protein
MAQRVQIILEDDYDGGTADETVSFALDGAEYEIDLSSSNAAGLRDALAPWLAKARKTGGRRKRSTKVSGASSTSDIRAWAQGQRTRGQQPRPRLGRCAGGVRKSSGLI